MADLDMVSKRFSSVEEGSGSSGDSFVHKRFSSVQENHGTPFNSGVNTWQGTAIDVGTGVLGTDDGQVIII